MYKLVFVSRWGDSIDLTNNPYAWLINADGLTQATTTISDVVVPGVDGDTINNIQANPRGILLDLRIKNGVNVETAKKTILGIIKLKQLCSLLWTQNGRTWKISGTVESVDMPRYNNAVTLQVAIHCAQPFWTDVNETTSDIEESKPLHYFTDYPDDMLYFPEDGIVLSEIDTSRTRTIVNTGDVSTGLEIEVLAYKTVTNPLLTSETGAFFGVGYAAKPFVMAPGDVLKISTVAGEKSVTMNGVSYIDYIKPRSTWLQLAAGENELSVSSDDAETDNMTFTLSYKQRYI